MRLLLCNLEAIGSCRHEIRPKAKNVMTEPLRIVAGDEQTGLMAHRVLKVSGRQRTGSACVPNRNTQPHSAHHSYLKSLRTKIATREKIVMAQSTSPSIVNQAAVLAETDSPPAGEASASLAEVQALLMDFLPKAQLTIYEAGGGSTSYLPRSMRERSRLSVVDIDAVQLDNNTYADEAILGDIQTHRFPDKSFDLIACYNVIEHLPRADLALENFADAVRSDGLIFIGAPNPRSLSGVITKYTPHAFHIWFYKKVLGRRNAGLPGEPPFPTHFHPLVSIPNLRAFFASRGFEILYERTYESPRYSELRADRPVLARLLDGITKTMNALSANKFNVRHGDYHLLVRKK